MSTAPEPIPPPPMTLGELLWAVRADLRHCLAALAAFEVLFKALVGLVFLPGLALLLFSLVRWSGRTALTNEDILSFALSPWGVLYGFLAGLKVLGVTLLEHAGVTAVVALKRTGHWHGFRHAMVVLATRTFRVLRLTGLFLGIAALALAPFAAAAALAYHLLLGGQDINYYLADRPPRFYVACSIGAALLLGALALAATLYVRWAFSLCVVLFEDRNPIPALAVSAARTRGVRWRIAAVLLGWQLIGVVGQLAVLGLFRLIASGVLAGAGHSPRSVVPVVVILLALHGLAAAAVSAVVVSIHCLLVLRLYVQRGLRLGVLDADHWADTLDETTPAPRAALARLEWGVAGVVVVFAGFVLGLTTTIGTGEKIQVTAHRGYSRAAPENTLAAVRKAIEVGADWAEIDVHETRDGEIVLLHDADLRRMTGDPRRLADVSLAELRDLKLHRRFGDEFASERLTTLREVIEAARGKIRLNIELKFYGKDYSLARKVADLVEEMGFEDQCFVASLNYQGVREAKKHRPSLRAGVIVTAAVGDISKLEVDILSVNVKLADDDLLRKARRLGKEVHVWTVNDPRTMRRLLDRGVNNIITDDPKLFLELRQEHDELGDAQKLLLACRHLLD